WHGCVRRLQHAYALKAELDAGWAARPVALARYNGRMALVLEDPGGAPVDRLLGRPLDVSHFLRIAIPLAGALRRVHERGLIHKDIKPANILMDAAGGGVWLTGFGIASRLPREHQAPALPEVIAGTLAYMAPEQTGRMNRSVDSRSDLYALGVTFYQMLTGQLPFAAADPMEWVHCHIARQPMPPNERVGGVPGALSAIVMKLLAKTAEERYQTAAGVEADLRRCLVEWEATGRIGAFLLGAHDVSDRLLIPEKLYGREREIDTLLASFDRVVADGTLELVLVLVIGKQPAVADLPPQDAQNRFQMVFRRFLGVFARKEHPLALFLDDLQWLDAATLDLLEDLATQPDVRHLMLVGAYRDNEVDSAHPLTRKLEAIRKAGARVQEIILAPLACEDLGRLLADSLHCAAE